VPGRVSQIATFILEAGLTANRPLVGDRPEPDLLKMRLSFADEASFSSEPIIGL